MKKILTIFSFLSFIYTQAQIKDTVYTKATLTKATVYYGYGADLAHTAKATIKPGMQQIVISNVGFQPDLNTLQISCPENVTIMSYIHRIYTTPPKENKNPNLQKYYDSIKQLQMQISVINNDIQINEDQLRRITTLIENNFTTPDKKNISSEELMKLTNYYTEKVNVIKIKLFQFQLKRNDCNDKINDINQRINDIVQNENQPSPEGPVGQLIIQILAKEGGAINLDFNYFTRTAGWVPTYDIRVKSIDNSMKLVYKALVTQNTGLNWNGVKLSLSTNNPNLGNNLPYLTPSYLQTYVPAIYSWTATGASYNQAPVMNEVVVTKSTADQKLTLKKNEDLDGNVSDFMTLSESQLNTNYEIDLPFDIPSDGVAYSVNIKEEKLSVHCQHFAVPKLDEDAFLLAKLARWDSLSLLPGQANIIMDNIYLGKSYLNPNTTEDTLQLSLGRDKRIAIDRKSVKETKPVKKSDKKTEIFTQEITIRNNKKQEIQLELKDQYPISKVAEVEVSLNDDGKAVVDAETGILTWNIKLQPGETQKIKFSYQIKYPKDKILQEYK